MEHSAGQSPAPRYAIEVAGTDRLCGLLTVHADEDAGHLLLDGGDGLNAHSLWLPIRVDGHGLHFWLPRGVRAVYWQPRDRDAQPVVHLASGLRSVIVHVWRRLGRQRLLRALSLLVQSRAPRTLRWLPDANARLSPQGWRVDGDTLSGRLYCADGMPLGQCQLSIDVDCTDLPADPVLHFSMAPGCGALTTSLGPLDSKGYDQQCFVPLATQELRLDFPQVSYPLRIRRAEIRYLGVLASLRPALQARMRHSRQGLFGAAWGLLLAPGPQANPGYTEYLTRIEPPLSRIRPAVLRHIAAMPHRPCISVIVPVYRTPLHWLQKAIDSVTGQLWPHWQLCLADDASGDPELRRFLQAAAAADSRIRVIECASNGGIAAATNAALSLADGEFVAFLDHDDELHPLALYQVASLLQTRRDVDLIYTDEDKIDEHGRRYDPHFKPGWDPDLLEAINYIAHLCVLRRSLLERLGGLRPGFDGSQDHELMLRVTAAIGAERIAHIPWPLYHWRAISGSTAKAPDQKSYPHQAGLRAVGEAVAAKGARVSDGAFVHSYRVEYPLPSPAPRVSVIIPTRDGLSQLRVCIDSLLNKTRYPDFEILLVDNQSRDPDMLEYLAALAGKPQIRLLRHDAEFNYSAINNRAAEQASGSVLVLLNDDTEVLREHWLSEMVSLALRPDTGAVGAKLYYPDGSIQHAGVALGVGGVAGHLHLHAPGASNGYMGRLRVRQSAGAVTGACLAVEKRKYDAVGGLDEIHLKVAFNDVDLCLRLAERGWRSVWTPWAELRHHESKSRGRDSSPDKLARFDAECRYMQQRWGAQLQNDPYLNPHFSRRRPDYSFNERQVRLRPWLQAEATP